MTPSILSIGTTRSWVVSLKPRLVYCHGKSFWLPLDRSLGGSQSRSGHGGKEKRPIIDPAGKWTPVPQPVA